MGRPADSRVALPVIRRERIGRIDDRGGDRAATSLGQHENRIAVALRRMKDDTDALLA